MQLQNVVSRRHRTLLVLTLTASIANILLFYSFSYSNQGIQKIPIGWDTPYYITGINKVREGMVIEYLQGQDYVNFIYAIVASLIPLSSIEVEMFFPISLAIGVVVSTYLFSRSLTSNIVTISSVVLFSSAWQALYRITSDLHAQLLAIPLIFIAFSMFINAQKDWKRFIVPSLILVSSFTHFETTVFLLLALFISLIVINKFKYLSKIIVYAVLPIIPATVIFTFHLFNSVALVPELRITHDPVPNQVLIDAFGYYWPLIVVAIAISVYNIFTGKIKLPKDNRIHLFMLFSFIWLALSIFVFYLDYIDKGLYFFSYRAAFFLPVPLLAAIPIHLLSYQKLRLRHNVLRYGIIILIVSGFSYANLLLLIQKEQPFSNIPYMSDDAYLRLLSLKDMRFTAKPIFVYYPIGENPGAIAEYTDNWVAAIYGDHYTYVGFVDALVNAQETSFSESSSKFMSYKYISKMRAEGIWNVSTISQHPIIVISDYYRVTDLGDSPLFREISDGIYTYEANKEAVESTQYNILALRKIDPSNQLWYLVEDPRDRNRYLTTAAPLNEPKPYQFRLYLDPSSCYTITFRYYDGGLGLGFKVDAQSITLSTVYYEETKQLKNISTNYCPTTSESLLSIVPLIKPAHSAETLFVSISEIIDVEKR